MSTALAQNHEENVYITVTIDRTSTLFNKPDGLNDAHHLLTHLGQVGELQDVQLLSVPRPQWPDVEGDVVESLKGVSGVLRVDVQDLPKLRVKRGGDEL